MAPSSFSSGANTGGWRRANLKPWTMPADRKKLALNFVLTMGVVSLFADMTYEGMRGIAGQFLLTLGASAAVVGFVAGFGELAGYGFRSVFGYLADKTHKYWAFIIAGYVI